MRKAALDIGSNSILLLVGDLEGDQFKLVYENFYYPRLGKGLAGTGLLQEKRMLEAEECLKEALEKCQELKVEKVIAGATAAVREARNGGEFTDRIMSSLDLEIKIISGEEEAELTYLGAIPCLDKNRKMSVLDVGGGSSELCTGTGEKLEFRYSAPIGAVKLADKYGKNPGLIPEAHDWIKNLLRKSTGLAQGHELVGVGGTITTLAAIYKGMEIYNPEEVASTVFSKQDIDNLIEKFRCLRISEISQLPGMEPSRADIIEAGATIYSSFMEMTGIDNISVSPYGFRYGLFLKY